MALHGCLIDCKVTVMTERANEGRKEGEKDTERDKRNIQNTPL